MSYILRKVNDPSGVFRVAICWLENSFSLILIKEKAAYTASVSSDYLEKHSKLLKHDFVQYCNNLKEYLEKDNEKVPISFKETQKVFDVNYVIGTRASIKYFSIELIEIDYVDCVENIIDSLSERNLDANTQINVLQDENKLLKNELNKYKSKLEEFVNAKRLSDKQMLSNFVVLLNEKKSRIEYLTELLEAFKGGRKPSNPSSVQRIKKPSKRKIKLEEKNSANTKTTKREVISDSESDQDVLLKSESMEIDYNSEEEKMKRLATDEAIPSTSKVTFDFLKEDSPPRPIKSFVITKNTSAESNLLGTNKTSPPVQTDDTETAKIQSNGNRAESPLCFNTQDMLDEL